eukprot:scaffold85724_cov50-Attheya_sp.AAC.13
MEPTTNHRATSQDVPIYIDFTMAAQEGQPLKGGCDPASAATTLKYIEFYSGVGGWTMALEEARRELSSFDKNKKQVILKRLAAYDHSDVCHDVFAHNHIRKEDVPDETIKAGSKRPRKKVRLPPTLHRSIDALTVKQLEAFGADIWVMSPPCQPHTRQHAPTACDARTQSFDHLMSLLINMNDSGFKKPSIILLENVVGFESSPQCRTWLETLTRLRYAHIRQFHLTPTQVGIPNDRPRYYSMAVLGHSPHKDSSVSLKETAVPTLERGIPELQIGPPQIEDHGDHPEKTLNPMQQLPPISDFLDSRNQFESLLVSEKLLRKSSAWCFDIVTPKDRRSACFTSSYGRFVRGTGSVLYMGEGSFVLTDPQDRQYDANWSEGLVSSKQLRYFSGKEVARLMGFSSEFSMPSNISLRQQWKILGNSINVRVAARVTQLALQLHLEKESCE